MRCVWYGVRRGGKTRWDAERKSGRARCGKTEKEREAARLRPCINSKRVVGERNVNKDVKVERLVECDEIWMEV